MSPLRMEVFGLLLTMLAPIVQAGAKLGCHVTKSEVEFCCYAGNMTTTTTTTTFSYQYVSITSIQHVWNSYSRRTPENFASLGGAKKACDGQPQCAGVVKHKAQGFFWVETCGRSSHNRSMPGTLVEEVYYKVVDASGGPKKCVCPKGLMVYPWRPGTNENYKFYMGVYNFVSQTDGSDPKDKSGHRPIYKLAQTCTDCVSVYLYYRIGAVSSGWIISSEGFESTSFAKLRNSDDDLCPTTLSVLNWQGVTSAGHEADMLHLDNSIYPPRVPSPWMELFDIKIIDRDIYDAAATSSGAFKASDDVVGANYKPGAICLFSSICETYPVIKSDFDQCCLSAGNDKKLAFRCSRAAFEKIKGRVISIQATTLQTTTLTYTTLSGGATGWDAPLKGKWQNSNIPPGKPKAVTSSSPSLLPLVGTTLGLTALWAALHESASPLAA